jgi:chromosomal replication initiator protein
MNHYIAPSRVEMPFENYSARTFVTNGIMEDISKPYKKEKRLSDESVFIERLCNHFNITLAQLNSRDRKREVCIPRQIAMKILHEVYDKSYRLSGEPFGRDHATAMHACKTISNFLETDRKFKEQYLKIYNLTINNY